MKHWVKRLLPYAKGRAVWVALEKARDEKYFPSVGGVLELIEQEQRRDTLPYVPPKPLTPEESSKSDRAAILSMLWLEYTKGFGPVHIGGIVSGCMARIYAKQFGKTDADIEAAMVEARAKYPREFVLRWMEEQQRIGN